MLLVRVTFYVELTDPVETYDCIFIPVNSHVLCLRLMPAD